MDTILFSLHALEQMRIRGVTRDEVVLTVSTGEKLPANRGRIAFRKNFPFRSSWQGSYYEVKQVMAIVAEDIDKMVVVTVYSFYFGGGR